MIIDNIISDIDSPEFFEAEYDGHELFLYKDGGHYVIYGVSESEYFELYRNRDHDTCLSLLFSHRKDYFYR